MSPKTVPCAKVVRAGRLRKAEQFLTVAAETLDLAGEQHDVGDAYATLCVTAGIAAADVICCALLGKHAAGEDYREAVALLKQADKMAARHLDTLLGMKTRAAYTSTAVSADGIKRAERAAVSLVESARQAHATAG